MPNRSSDPSAVLTRAAPPPTTTVRYGELPDQVADLWLPEPTPSRAATLPLVILIHGGFWRAGFDRMHLRPMANAVAAQGFSVAAIEYRRTGYPGGGWPGTCDDVRSAVDQLPTLVASHVGTGARSVLLAGHSAGGHLALWAGAQVPIPGLAGILSLAGVCDLVRADELGLGAQGDDGAVAAFLGGRYREVPERYAAADPMQLPAPSAPVVLVHGTLDTDVPVEISRRYADRAASTGADVELTELAGIEHFGPIDPLSPAWGAVLDALHHLARR
jgi:acetyl esterase/lipase